MRYCGAITTTRCDTAAAAAAAAAANTAANTATCTAANTTATDADADADADAYTFRCIRIAGHNSTVILEGRICDVQTQRLAQPGKYCRHCVQRLRHG